MEIIGPIALIELRNYKIRSQMTYIKLLTSVVCSSTRYNPVYHTFFYFVWKETTHRPLSDNSKNPFLQCVCYWYNLLRWMFFILSDNWKTLHFIIVYRYSEIALTAMLLHSLKPLFWRKSIFYALTPQKYDANTTVPK